MGLRSIAWLLVCGTAAALAASELRAANDASASTGYGSHCASCHGPELEGSQFGPALKGPAVQARWNGQAAAAFASYVETRMPPANAGSLGGRVYAEIETHVLATSGLAAANGMLVTRSVSPAGAPARSAGSRSRVRSLRSATSPRPNCSPASSISTGTAISRSSSARRGLASTACSRAAMSWTRSTARR